MFRALPKRFPPILSSQLCLSVLFTTRSYGQQQRRENPDSAAAPLPFLTLHPQKDLPLLVMATIQLFASSLAGFAGIGTFPSHVLILKVLCLSPVPPAWLQLAAGSTGSSDHLASGSGTSFPAA